jgi:hypothetical protein
MKKSPGREEQIGWALRQAELGAHVAGVIPKMGVPEETFYRCNTTGPQSRRVRNGIGGG